MELNGKEVSLKYSLNRVDKIEQTLDKSLGEMVVRGSFKINEMKVLVGYALKYEGEGEGYISPVQGMEYAEKIIKENGIAFTQQVIADALQRDCPFFFLVD